MMGNKEAREKAEDGVNDQKDSKEPHKERKSNTSVITQLVHTGDKQALVSAYTPVGFCRSP